MSLNGSLTRWLADESQRAIQALPPAEKQKILQGAWRTIVGTDDPIKDQPNQGIKVEGQGDYTVILTISAIKSDQGETPVVANKREFAGYTHGYNHSHFAKRARAILAAIRKANKDGKKVELIPDTETVAYALAACAAAEKGSVKTIVAPAPKVQFEDITSYRHPQFVPGAIKYGGFSGLHEVVKGNGTEVVTQF